MHHSGGRLASHAYLWWEASLPDLARGAHDVCVCGGRGRGVFLPSACAAALEVRPCDGLRVVLSVFADGALAAV